jgi:hypothetical protein
MSRAFEDEADSLGDKAFASPKKPAFSLPVMANNFRRFKERDGMGWSIPGE